MKAIYMKLFLILVIQVTFAVVKAESQSQEELQKSVSFMIDLLKEDRESIRAYMDQCKNKLAETASKLEKDSQEIKKKSDEIEARAKSLEQKAAELATRREELRKKHEEIHQKQQQYGNHNFNTGGSYRDFMMKWSNMYKEAIIYHDIHDALAKGIISKRGNPTHWDNTSYTTASNKWNGRGILRMGHGAQNLGNGVAVQVPKGYDVMWIRCSNQHWGRVWVSFKNKKQGDYTCGYRQLNEISPDGGAPDSFHTAHMWTPIPVSEAGEYLVMSGANGDNWWSGIAFGKNLWNHARMSAVGIHWAVNGGDGVGWHSHNWNNDNLAYFNQGRVFKIRVPVVENGKDKLFYVVEHNNNWLGTMHTSVKVEGTYIDRFSTSYSNPFATHFNSKWYQRYIATRIPKELIPKGENFIEVEINMTSCDHNLHFRELGTHDME